MTSVTSVTGFQFGCRNNRVIEVVGNCIRIPMTGAYATGISNASLPPNQFQ